MGHTGTPLVSTQYISSHHAKVMQVQSTLEHSRPTALLFQMMSQGTLSTLRSSSCLLQLQLPPAQDVPSAVQPRNTQPVSVLVLATLLGYNSYKYLSTQYICSYEHLNT